MFVHKPDSSVLLPWIPMSTSPIILLNPLNHNNSSHSHRNKNVRPCLMCHARKSNFYCQNCIKSGGFYHSNPRVPEAFAEKQLNLKIIQEKLRRLQLEVLAEHARIKRDVVLRDELKLVKQNIKYHKNLIREKRENVSKMQELNRKLRLVNRKRRDQLPKFAEKVQQIHQATFQHQSHLGRDIADFEQKEQELSGLRRKRALEMVQQVFPVRDVLPQRNQDMDKTLSEDDIQVLETLADAMDTSFVNGQWILTREMRHNDVLYQVVEPLLPSKPDYKLVMPLGVPDNSELLEVSQTQTIQAGLMFTSLLVQHLATLFNVQLPQPLDHQVYGSTSTSEFRHAYNLHKLDLDLLYLSITQGVKPENLKISHTLYNLKELLTHIQNPLNAGLVGRSFKCSVPDIDIVHDISLKMSEMLDKVPRTSLDLQEIHAESTALNRIYEECEGDWDALNDALVEVGGLDGWENNSSNTPSSSSTLTPSMSTAYFVSSLWRGITN